MRILTAALLLLAPLAAGADWRGSAADGYLEFVPTYDSTPLPGRFGAFEVLLHPGGATPAGGSLEVTVHVDSADMQDADLNDGISGPDFFDFIRFPQARFTSRDIRPGRGEHRFVARGELDLKGHHEPVRVPFSWLPGPEGVEMSGSLNLSRGAFGIGVGEWAGDDTIGDAVAVRFHLVLHETP